MDRLALGRGYTFHVPSACIVACVVVTAYPASANPVHVDCARVSLNARAELQARARLLLSSAGVTTVTVRIGCDDAGAWLIWNDQTRATLPATTPIVEAVLDAIEARLAIDRHDPPAAASNDVASESARPGSPPDAVAAAKALGAAGGAKNRGNKPSDDASGDQAKVRSSETVSPRDDLAEQAAAQVSHGTEPLTSAPLVYPGNIEGGVSLATVTEFWTDALGLGPRLEVGVGLGRHWAGVVSEGARFASAGRSATAMAFDLQAGVSFGAPYTQRDGLGLVALVGAERLASGGDAGVWLWSLTSSLGLRGSLACGPFDAWVGVDLLARTHHLETAGDRIPPVTALLTLGVLMPAFSPHLSARITDAPLVSTGL